MPTYVFHGGPLDGREIEASAGTSIYRNASGESMSANAGDRARGGIYSVQQRPARTVENGQVVNRPGIYRWREAE
jgi:hypothetical protein